MSVCLSAAPLPVTPALAWLDAAEAAMDVPEHSVIDPVLTRQGLARIERFKARVAAREAHLIRIVDASTVPKDSEATSTGSLISHDFGGDQSAASRQVRTANNLRVAFLTEKALEAIHQHDIVGRPRGGHIEWLINGLWQTNHRWRP